MGLNQLMVALRPSLQYLDVRMQYYTKQSDHDIDVMNVSPEWTIEILILIGVRLIILVRLLIDVMVPTWVRNLSMRTNIVKNVITQLIIEMTTLVVATQKLNVKQWVSSLMISQWSVSLNVLITNTMTSMRLMNVSFVTLSLRIVIDALLIQTISLTTRVGTIRKILCTLFVLNVSKITHPLNTRINVLFVKIMSIWTLILTLDARSVRIMSSI